MIRTASLPKAGDKHSPCRKRKEQQVISQSLQECKKQSQDVSDQQAFMLHAVAEFAAWVMENNMTEVWYTETLYINTRITKQYKELQYYKDGTSTKKVGGILYTEPELPTGI